MKAQEIIKFWFEEIESKQHWVKDPVFDTMILERFQKVHSQAMAGELFDWRETSEGRLAEVIVLDQFSRNMYRDTPGAFASDSLALVLAQEAVRCGDDQKIDKGRRSFLYMPYMHSESLKVHDEAVKLFETLSEGSLDYEHKHRNIIEKYGRYPHRNEILSRQSTAEEIKFLSQPGSSF